MSLSDYANTSSTLVLSKVIGTLIGLLLGLTQEGYAISVSLIGAFKQ